MIDVYWKDSDVVFFDTDVIWSPLSTSYEDIPPFMEADIIDPYSGGAWLWLLEIHFTGYDTIYLARNTEDVTYADQVYTAHNIKISQQRFISDGSIPRNTIRIAQDGTYELEDKLNEAQGVTGHVKLIRTNEKFLDSPVGDLERTYSILGAKSDWQWFTLTLGIPNPLHKKFPLRSTSSKKCPYHTPALFKGVECQYAGADSTCTGLYEDCFEKGHAAYWGGELGLDAKVMKI